MSPASVPRVGVVGAGAWGTALATVIARAGVAEVLLHARDPAVRAAIGTGRQNPRLEGVTLAPAIVPTADPVAAADAPVVVMAVPAQVTRSVLRVLAAAGARPATVVLTAKGIETGTGALQGAILAEEMPTARAVVLSGPSFAVEVAAGLPAAVVVAAEAIADAEAMAALFASDVFRPYAGDDPVGVQLGGALKNIYAIASGILVGRGLGESARAALIARSVAELDRLAIAAGARPATVAGLSGLGDLVLTATSEKSRNFRHGLALGRGVAADPAGPLVEGAATAGVAVAMARRLAVALPVGEAVAAVLSGTLAVDKAVGQLLRRPLRRESDNA